MKTPNRRCRTLLIAEIDKESNHFLTLMSNAENQIALSDEQVENLEKNLLVHNLKEFDKKFPIKQFCCSEEKHTTRKQSIDEKADFAEALYTYGKHQYEVWYDTEQYNKWYEWYDKEQMVTDTEQYNWCEGERKKIEIRLGVKVFFEQNREQDISLELLVLNVNPSELAEKKNLDKLKLYLDTVNQKTEKRSSIQYAILPEVDFSVKLKKISGKRFPGREDFHHTVSSEAVKKLAHVLSENQVITFLQYATGYETSAQVFAQKGLTPFKEEGYQYEHTTFSEYLSCCFPNLTMHEGKIYIGAAYVVAGMLSVKTDEGQESTLPRELYPYSVQTREEMEIERYGCTLVSEYSGKRKGSNKMILLSTRTMSWQNDTYSRVKNLSEGSNVSP